MLEIRLKNCQQNRDVNDHTFNRFWNLHREILKLKKALSVLKEVNRNIVTDRDSLADKALTSKAKVFLGQCS